MSNFGFLPTNIPRNPPNPIFSPDHDVHQQYFQPSDYDLMLSTDGSEEDNTISFKANPSQDITGAAPNIPVYRASSSELPWSISDVQEGETGMAEGKSEGGSRIAFRTKSDLEIMDDGFKWRKYGKKKVKNSPNPRNYYKCSSGGCNVKKRVERDREDSRFVITTYEGVHNHHSPCVMYSNGIPPLDFPSQWNSSHPFSSQ
ncbi:hypothetical protein SLE2022_329010 [Rubroshorea leprosula]